MISWLGGILAGLSLIPIIQLLHRQRELSISLIVISLAIGGLGVAVGAALAYGYRKTRFIPQQRMNRLAHEAYERAEAEMQNLLNDIRGLNLESEQRDEFDDAQRKWEEYRDAQASFDAVEVKGGTMWPTLFYTTMQDLTEQRGESLRKLNKYLRHYHTPTTERFES